MKRVRIHGEGRREIGVTEEDDIYGVLPNIIVSILQSTLNSTPRICFDLKKGLPRTNEHAGGKFFNQRMGAGSLRTKTRLALSNADSNGFDGVVIVMDRDGPENGDRIEKMVSGRDLANNHGVFIPSALGVAVEAIEAWILGDPSAVSSALAGNPSMPINDPENLKGKRGSGSHPKDRLGEILAEDNSERTYAEKVADIIRQLNSEKLKTSCPLGFAPFAAEVENNLGVIFLNS